VRDGLTGSSPALNGGTNPDRLRFCLSNDEVTLAAESICQPVNHVVALTLTRWPVGIVQGYGCAERQRRISRFGYKKKRSQASGLAAIHDSKGSTPIPNPKVTSERGESRPPSSSRQFG